MSSTTAPISPASPSTQLENVRSPWPVLIPYFIAFASQVPLLMLYFRQLWARPHYQIFPIAIGALLFFAWNRWPHHSARPFQRSLLSSFLMVMAVGFGLMGFLFVEPWFAAVCTVCLFGSLFARTIDPESQRSLFPITMLALICLIPPLNGDQRLISWLQLLSAHFTSQILDLLGYPHYMPGTVIRVPGGKGFGIDEACSGVMSFFTLLTVAVIFVVAMRRPWFRSSILLLSATFWAIFMNTIRILAIPLADSAFQWDLAHGLAHDVLGYTTLILGILFMLSTDQFLFFLFGPVETFGEEGGRATRSVSQFWNRVISGKTDSDIGGRKKRRESSPLSRGLIWSVAILLMIGGLFNISDVIQSLNKSSLQVRFFDTNVAVPLAEGDLPASLENWTRVKYESSSREIGSDLGQYSDIWVYQAPRCMVFTSMDQTFPGWHELTTCYTNQGWKLVPGSRTTKSPTEGAPGDANWSFVVAEFERETGERGFLVFSHFDAYGEGFEAPRNWDFVNALLIRAKNRLNHRIRSRLFRGEAYQTQAFVQSYGVIDDVIKDEVVDRYLQVREVMRTKFLEKRDAGATMKDRKKVNEDPKKDKVGP